jgi:NifU-like protein involved in Fe-S cluster formation
MDSALYNVRILRLAASIPHAGRLDPPHHSATRSSPICGSRVTADLRLDESGLVTAFAQEVRACALGQASAAVLGAGVLGASHELLAASAEALRRWLEGRAALPEPLASRFPELACLEPARAHPARHASIRLPFEAAAAASVPATGQRTDMAAVAVKAGGAS